MNETKSSPVFWKSFAAGSIAGAAGQCLGHPLDSLKVHAQSGKETPPLRHLYRGLAMPMMTAGLVQMWVLGLYENIRRELWPAKDKATPLWRIGVAGSIAGKP